MEILFKKKQEYGSFPVNFYTSNNAVRCIELKSGVKIYYTNKEICLKTSKDLSDVNINHRVGYNEEANIWSIAIL